MRAACPEPAQLKLPAVRYAASKAIRRLLKCPVSTAAWILTVSALAMSVVLCILPAPAPLVGEAEQTAQIKGAFIKSDTVFSTLAGGETSVSSHWGSVVFVYVWASWSPYCERGMPSFAAFGKRCPEAVCLYLNAGEPTEQVQTFLSKLGLSPDPAHVLLDTGGIITPSVVASEGLPAILVYNASGRLVKRYGGVLGQKELEAAYRVASRS